MNIPGFMIKGVLGQGAMATVYLAHENSLARDVALKVISLAPPTDNTTIRLFLRECQTVASLKHPNIITLYQLKQEQNSIHMAMELMPGGSLKDRISKGITLEQSLSYVRQIADALEVVHNRGIIHRDIKPANILFMDEHTPVLTDFGIAKDPQHNNKLGRPGAVMGTPNYMSPEQAQGKPIDGRSDLYSLGVLFYEMLSGKLPFYSKDAMEVAVMHIQDPIPKLPDALAGAQTLLDQLLAKRPEDRYPTASAFCRALDAMDLSSDKQLLGELRHIGSGNALAHTFKSLKAAQRASGLTLLLEEGRTLWQKQRNAPQTPDFSHCLRALLEWEIQQNQQEKICYERWSLEVLSLWLEEQNQASNFVAEEAQIQQGLAAAKALQDSVSTWQDWEITARFYNEVALNYLTAPYVEEAIEKANRILKEYVDYLRKYCQKTPLGPLRARWIGALYSTFAQTLAYSAHNAFFKNQDIERAERLTSGALQYSEKALAHFDEEADRRQQYTYQAQVHLQHYLLLKRPQAHRTAIKLLAKAPSPEQAVSHFLADFAEGKAIVPAYRLAVMLKSTWLASESPKWLAPLQQRLLETIDSIQALYPYPHILGYLALLTEEPFAHRRLRDTLAHLHWKNSNAVCAQLFLAQIEYNQHQVLAKNTLARIIASVHTCSHTDNPKNSASNHYIVKELARYRVEGQGHLPGPLALLPCY